MTAIRATFEDVKRVKTRKVWQLIFEVPEEDYDAAIQTLGGSPQSGTDRWVGIAPITAPADVSRETVKPKRPWNELNECEQSVLACKKPEFQVWICAESKQEEVSEENAALAVRSYCSVTTRADIPSHDLSKYRWNELWARFLASQRGQELEQMEGMQR